MANSMQGQFWLSEEPNNRIQGELTFPADGSLALTTDGDFGELSDFDHGFGALWRDDPDHMDDPVNIEGRLLSDYVKMTGCVAESSTGASIGRYLATTPTVKWVCGIGFIGDEFEGDIPSQITSATVRLTGFEDWVSGIPAIRVSGGFHQGTVSWDNEREAQSGSWALGKLSIRGQTLRSLRRSRHHIDEVVLSTDIYAHVEFDDPQPWPTVFAIVESLQCLTTIATGEPSGTKSVRLSIGQEAGRGIAAYYRSALRKEDDSVNFPALLAFSDLGGVDGLCRWLDCVYRRGNLRSALTVDLYRPPPFITDQTGHLLAACEALMRYTDSSKTGQLRLNRDILEPLMDRAGDPFLNYLDDCGQWKSTINQIRNHFGIAHVQENSKAPEAQKTYEINQQIYLLVVVCLLRECGAEEDLIETILARSRSKWRVIL